MYSVNKFKCPMCGRKFKGPNSLDRHMRVMHRKSIWSMNNPSTFEKIISLKIDRHTYDELKNLAAKDGITVSQFIRSLIYLGITGHRKGRKTR